jgi:hypothetical protein
MNASGSSGGNGESWLAPAIGLLLTAVTCALAAFLVTSTEYDIWAVLWIAPVLTLISLPVLDHQARTDNDRRVFWLLFAALLLKLAGGIARFYVAEGFYGGPADAGLYHKLGVDIAGHFRDGDFVGGLELAQGFRAESESLLVIGTQFMPLLTGVIYMLIGPSILGGFVFFSWLGFWGLFFFYRAFRRAFPEGSSRTYAYLVFFLPSLIFWPSSIGKEAWMVFALGLAAYGAASLFSRGVVRGVVFFSLGVGLVSVVRTHVGAMLILAIGGAYLFHRPSVRLRELAPVVKTATLAGFAVLGMVFIILATQFLSDRNVALEGEVTSVLETTAERISLGEGGSDFTPSPVTSPADLPIAIVTALYRPLPFEARNIPMLVAALEGTLLLTLTLLRFRWLVGAIKSFWRSPYMSFAIFYAGMLIVAFSSFTNFGLLARQRAQLLPFFLVLLAVPPRTLHRSLNAMNRAGESLRTTRMGDS